MSGGGQMDGVDAAKQALRDKVWRLLEQKRAVPEGSYGTIPGFYGAEATAERLAATDAWHRARTVKANPDWAQLPVRARALEDRKHLYMAIPRMADPRPFYELDPDAITVPLPEAADKEGAARAGKRVGAAQMRPIDLVVCGSVAVNRSGARIGKGAGYSDLEVALLIEAGLITDATTIVAPVHGLQVVDDDIPESAHDFAVDLIVTPEELIPCPRRQRPAGVVWENLTDDKIAAIPVLAESAPAQRGVQR
ncbi:5-formyltetrahydrofolate cyclo-ligase [Nocardiopsis chromatogenes]|uniref:5-formyltetrahydrofolate cyclo-ligase n=1 Tax=Nocardiopsis chromatogenes TaxID=280239 RepID=UPI000349F249|nr:5-formyltetrahydrofolate cyclo-ligase [Nocardiopsis chromatogenes]